MGVCRPDKALNACPAARCFACKTLVAVHYFADFDTHTIETIQVEHAHSTDNVLMARSFYICKVLVHTHRLPGQLLPLTLTYVLPIEAKTILIDEILQAQGLNQLWWVLLPCMSQHVFWSVATF